jgi:hypothetical protein
MQPTPETILGTTVLQASPLRYTSQPEDGSDPDEDNAELEVQSHIENGHGLQDTTDCETSVEPSSGYTAAQNMSSAIIHPTGGGTPEKSGDNALDLDLQPTTISSGITSSKRMSEQSSCMERAPPHDAGGEDSILGGMSGEDEVPSAKTKDKRISTNKISTTHVLATQESPSQKITIRLHMELSFIQLLLFVVVAVFASMASCTFCFFHIYLIARGSYRAAQPKSD